MVLCVTSDTKLHLRGRRERVNAIVSILRPIFRRGFMDVCGAVSFNTTSPDLATILIASRCVLSHVLPGHYP